MKRPVLGALVVSCLVGGASGSEPTISQEAPAGCRRKVVRAHFDDPGMVADVRRRTEIWEVSPESGYLVVEVDDQGLDWLVSLGFRVEIDRARTHELCTLRGSLPDQKRGIPGLPCYRTVEETFADAEALAARHPDLVEWIDIGDSWEMHHGQEPGFEGYDLMVLRLTNRAVPGVGAPADPGAKPVLFVEGGLHARECAPPELLMRFAEHLIGEYGISADATWLLDEHKIHLLLFANPDGRKRAETGLWWRKNANNNCCSDTDLRGVDLNRNFAYEWNCCDLSSDEECDLTYHGAFGASEPETQAIQDYLESVFPGQWNPQPPDDATGVFIDLHAYGDYMCWPWLHSRTQAPNNAALQTLARRLAHLNRYDPSRAPATIDGSAIDHAYGATGIASYLFEVGTAFFQGCDVFEARILPDNLDALLYAAKVARAPYQLPSGPTVTSIEIAPDTSVFGGETLLIEATADDTGFFSLDPPPEPTQDVVSVRFYLDRPPWYPNAPSVRMQPVDGAYDSPVETVELALETVGLAPGRHTVFLRAKDRDGSWGPVSAEFIWLFGSDSPTRQPGGRVGP